MRKVVALLAAVSLIGLGGCGDDGAEPGASHEATLVLDFTPNAVHSGIYAAQAEGDFAGQDIDLRIQEPGATSDATKLLAAGKADFAVMDINDLAIADQRGASLIGIASLVDKPLASVIAGRDAPRDLAGTTIGVTGVPSDDAVLDTVLDGLGTAPGSVRRVTIGFNSVSSLAAGKVDAATAFRNAEGVELEQQGVPVRVLPVQDYGAPDYPELVVVTNRRTLADDPKLVGGFVAALGEGSALARRDPDAALDALLEANPDLDRDSQAAQLDVLGRSFAADLDHSRLFGWANWARRSGITEGTPNIAAVFPNEVLVRAEQARGTEYKEP